jgi:hypothetical protein
MDIDLLKFALEEHEETPAPALEERSDGKAQTEMELVFYARLADTSALPATSDRESQEQWTIKIDHSDKNGGRGDIRVRKTDFLDSGDSGRTEYVLTTKVRHEGGKDKEIPIPSTADQFEHFKLLAENGMIKDRFTYTIDGSDLKWEVDLYHNPAGGFWPWVKIDLEVPSKDTPIPEFPFEAEEWIKGQNGERSPEEEAKVRELYETMFLTKNPAGKANVPVDAAPNADATDEQDDTVPTLAVEAKTEEFTGDWPELTGTPEDPTLTPSDEIFKSEDGSVQSEPDENRTVVGTEQLQEFSRGVKEVVDEMGVRLIQMSIGLGYIDAAAVASLMAKESPDLIPVAQGGDFGAQYYYVPNPAPGAVVTGIGFHFLKPTLSADQVQF